MYELLPAFSNKKPSLEQRLVGCLVGSFQIVLVVVVGTDSSCEALSAEQFTFKIQRWKAFEKQQHIFLRAFTHTHTHTKPYVSYL